MHSAASMLKRARLEQGLKHEKVSKDLKIQPRFLEALEEGNYSVFSSPVHLKGFLKNYAEYLGLDVSQVMAFWRREYDEKQKKAKVRPAVKALQTPLISFTPGTLIIAVTAVLVLGFFAYLIVAYRSFAGAPPLTINEPKVDARVSQSAIQVTGQTDRDVILSINGQEIALGADGEFATNVALSPGVNQLNFVAANRLGRETQITRTVVVEETDEADSDIAETSPSAEVAEEVGGVRVTLRVGPKAAWLEVFEGDEKVFEGVAVGGIEISFRHERVVKVSTGNGGATAATVNGEDLGPLGEEGEVVEREFSPPQE